MTLEEAKRYTQEKREKLTSEGEHSLSNVYRKIAEFLYDSETLEEAVSKMQSYAEQRGTLKRVSEIVSANARYFLHG